MHRRFGQQLRRNDRLMAAERVLVFARVPEPGKVKTRLGDGLGPDKALAVYAILLRHTKDILLRSGLDATIYLAGGMPESDVWTEAGMTRRSQSGSDLGERMWNAFQDAFRDGVRKAVVIGTDCPGLSPSILQEAMARLDSTEAVVVPAVDGGYVLLGLTSPVRSIFEHKRWSTDTVLHDTLADFHSIGMSFARLEPLRDVDTADDYHTLIDDHPWLRV